MSRLTSAWRILFPQNRKQAVSPKWLFFRSGIIDSLFAKNTNVTFKKQGDFAIINANGDTYVWPQGADLSALTIILSELSNLRHPHQYLYGKTQINKNDVVIDIGACEGTFSAKAAALGARPIIVEPSRVMTNVIKKLFELRHQEAPVIANVLLGLLTGELHFVDNPHNPGGSRVTEFAENESYAVPVWTLDHLAGTLQLEKLDFIKCDAEGADVDIMKGAEQTLRRFRPKVAVTTYHNSDDYNNLFDYFSSLGYNVAGKGLLYSQGEYRVLMLHAW